MVYPQREPSIETGRERLPAAGSFVARHPIYDHNLSVVAYELLFRAQGDDTAQISDPDAATAQTIVNTFSEIGLESIVGDVPAFINVTRGFLLGGFASLLPPSRIGLELLEDIPVDDALLAAVRDLSGQGYRIICDDFVYYESARPLLEVTNVVKLDLLALDPVQLGEHVRLLRRFGVELVAEKIESYEAFNRCRKLGFDYFQGFFFCRPRTFRGSVSASQLSKLHLISILQKPDPEMAELAELVSRDIGLSYRLLRYINSAFFGLGRKLTSIREAVIMVGQRNIKNWATLMLLADNGEKPTELVITAMVRARMCELLARSSGLADGDTAFTTGLLSVVDAIADAPLEQVVAELPLAEPVAAALLASEGALGRILRCVLDYEQGEIEPGRYPELESVGLEHAYLEALVWTEATREVVGGR